MVKCTQPHTAKLGDFLNVRKCVLFPIEFHINIHFIITIHVYYFYYYVSVQGNKIFLKIKIIEKS